MSRKTSGKLRPQPPEPAHVETDELRAKLEPVLAEKLKRPQDAHEVAELVATAVVVLLVFGGLGLAALEYELPGYTGFVTGVLLYVSTWIVGRRPTPKPGTEKPTERAERGGAHQ